MQIKKKEGTFNMYVLELSFGELVAALNALEDVVGGGAMVDEMRDGIRWYMDNLPGPGEDKEEFKAKKDAEKSAKQGGGPEELETGGPTGGPPDEGGPALEPPSEGGLPQPSEMGNGEGGGEGGGEGPKEADDVLPEPPKE